MPAMSQPSVKNDSDNVDFKWGIKRGRGGSKKDVQFYESFVYDGVEYFLYDSVYLFKDGESDPYIGKLIKIWELSNKSKKVKVLWFFHPSEVLSYIRDLNILENELFLACGDGVGLANINPLENSKWFTGLPWEERVKAAHMEGTLVLLQNLDPAYSSSEVEDIIWHGFKENCTAKVIPCTTAGGPPFGQAFVIMKTKNAARRVAQELQQACLMLPNGRPLVGRTGIFHMPGKQTSFPGHIAIDRLKLQMQRERKEAVSTSHSAQPNTLEYDMAMEWRILQERLDFMYMKLFKQQGEELKEQKAKLKLKRARVA